MIFIISSSWNSRKVNCSEHSLLLNIFYKLACEIVFFLIGIHSMQGLAPTARHGVTRKRSTKKLNHIGNLFRKNPQSKGVW